MGDLLEPRDLEYAALSTLLQPYEKKERYQSATFLNWFLENIFRLDEVAADDALCDNNNDKGIDGVYIDDINERIVLLQSKLRQNANSTLGDTDLKEFKGSLAQFSSPDAIDRILAGNANADLKKLLTRNDVKGLLEKGYSVHGIFVVNVDADDNAVEFLAHNPDIMLYDRARIAKDFIDLDRDPGIDGSFTFSCKDITPLEYVAKTTARLFLFPAPATELVKLQGIADGSLFSQNVRLALGNTKVNKDIQSTISDRAEHAKFPLFHNGITLICGTATYDRETLTVADYAVVNGAQSLTTLYKSREALTDDLRILTRVVETRGDVELARQITTNSNNQNAIKPRDSRSNHALQTRLKREFENKFRGSLIYEVKRGEAHAAGSDIITNEEAGRLLLAFDCEEPWSSHQVYKIFDDEYAKIFGRPEVDADRIVFLHRLMHLIETRLNLFKNKALSRYTIARYFLLYIVKLILKGDQAGEVIIRQPSLVVSDPEKWNAFQSVVDEMLKGVVVDLDYEFEKDGTSDYKSDLKSPLKAASIAQEVLRTYEKDVARGKAVAVSALAKVVDL